MVEHFQEMVERLLVAWYDQPQHKRFPANVLYYRDGIAKSQYAELEQTEIPAIQKAFAKVAEDKGVAVPPFNLTTVIVNKRHNTRLFPSTEKDAMNKNDNCHPGTLVDSAITDPYFSDFYLQSHNAIKGTARPCHYYVLNNGIGMNMGQLEQFVSHSSSYNHARR
jgi:eukaryotic translation initiation factor 2C